MLPIHSAKFTVYNYEEIPPGYYFEKMVNGGAVQRYWHQKKFEAVASKINDSETVVDVGCGPGSFLWLLNKMYPGVKATGVDVAGTQIQFAAQKLMTEAPNVSFTQLNNEKTGLPFEDGSYDVATMIEVVEHIHPHFALKSLQEIRRVLKEDGRLIITTPNYRSLWPFIEVGLETMSEVKYHDQHISKFTPNSFVKFIETCGFQVTSVSSIFVLAPFAAAISKNLANALNHLEQRLPGLPGSLLVVEAKKLKY